MDRIIIQDRFTAHQKITILLYFGGPFIAAIIAQFIIGFSTSFSVGIFFKMSIFLLIYVFLFFIAFLKRGFIALDDKLYRVVFLGRIVLLKKYINLFERPKLSVLQFKKTQKLPFFSAARPDMANEFNSFEINILNDKHTHREAIIDIVDEQKAAATVTFLTTHFDLQHEIFSPDFT